MTKQSINIGNTPNDQSGDSLRAAFGKINTNFTELYTALGINADVNLNLGAFEFAGSVLSTTDSSAIVIDQAVTVSSNLTVGGDVLPSVANGGDLGSSARPWKSLYISNNTIYIGGTAVGLDANGNLTTGGTVVGSTPAWANITGKPTIPTSFSSLVNGAKTVGLDANGVLTLPNSGEIFDYAGGAGVPGIFISRTFQTPDNTNASNFGANTLKLLLSDTEATEIGDYLSAGIGVRVWFTVGDSYPITSCVQVSAGIWTITATGMGNRFATFTVTNPLIFIYTGSTPNNYTNFAQYEPAGAGAAVIVFKGGNSWSFDENGDLNLPPNGTILDSGTGDSLLNPTKLINGAHELVLNVNGAGPWISFPESGGQQIQIQGTDIVGIGSFSPSLMSLENGVVISANSSAQNGPRRDWTFGTDGNLTIPGDIKSNGNINIEINLADSTLRRWSFGEDGALTFPDGTNYAGKDITLPQTYGGVASKVSWNFSDIVFGNSTTFLEWNLLSTDLSEFLIGTSSAATPFYFSFDGSGQTLGIITGGGIFGGGKLTFGSTAGSNAGDVNAIELKATNGDVYLTSTESVKITVDASDSSARVWLFDPTGNLTLPTDAVVKTTSGNLTIKGQSYVFIDSAGNGQINIGTSSGVGAVVLGSKSRGTNVVVDDLQVANGVYEYFSSLADATGVVTHNCANGHKFYHTSPDANWTVNLTNLLDTWNRATSVTLIITQGATGYYPSAVQIAGVAQTLNWQGNVTPTPSTNRTDVVTFSIINVSGTYTVLGQLTGF